MFELNFTQEILALTSLVALPDCSVHAIGGATKHKTHLQATYRAIQHVGRNLTDSALNRSALNLPWPRSNHCEKRIKTRHGPLKIEDMASDLLQEVWWHSQGEIAEKN